MKRKLYSTVFWIGICVFFFSACTNRPDWVVERFVKHWFKGELEEVKPFLTPETRGYADLLKNAKSPEEFEQMGKIKVKCKILDVTKQNDSVRVYRCEIALDGEEQEMDICAKRLKHRWFIDIMN